jgi:hypothetical protein
MVQTSIYSGQNVNRAVIGSLAIAVMVLATMPAMAEDNSYDLLLRLSLILGSEKACGLQFNKSAIYEYIDENVSGDVSFVPMLKSLTEGNADSVAELSPDELAAHCNQVRRAAANLGFMGDEK